MPILGFAEQLAVNHCIAALDDFFEHWRYAILVLRADFWTACGREVVCDTELLRQGGLTEQDGNRAIGYAGLLCDEHRYQLFDLRAGADNATDRLILKFA